MELLSLHSKVGNHYKPSQLLAQLLSERFQVPISDFNLGLLCLSPIGDDIKKARYKEVQVLTQLEDGTFLQTSNFIFLNWEESSGDGVFKIALSRYNFTKVRTVRISKKDLDLVSNMERNARKVSTPRVSYGKDAFDSKSVTLSQKRIAEVSDI